MQNANTVVDKLNNEWANDMVAIKKKLAILQEENERLKRENEQLKQTQEPNKDEEEQEDESTNHERKHALQ